MKIYRDNIQILDVEIDNSSIFKHAIMGDELCLLNFISETYTEFKIGDYLLYNSQKFVINTPAKLTKIANNEYSYNLRFEGIKYELSKILIQLDGKLQFPLDSDIEQIIDLIVINMNAVSGIVWEKGISSITPFYSFDINNENCLQVLNRACIQFEVEFEVVPTADKYIINVRDTIGVYEGVNLEYKKGIFKLTSEAVSQQNMITKLYAFGAAKNIPSTYDKDRITISPLTNNLTEYGTIEGIITYNDIYPSFTGNVSSASSNTFIDTSIDFDINSQLIPGVIAKVVFKSGDLSGFELEISSFNNTTKQITLVLLTDDIGRTLPNSNLQIQTNDRYTFVDIYMPQSYIDAAELELQTRAQTYIDRYSIPLIKYSIIIDARYLRENSIVLGVGQKIKLIDLDIAISAILRIYSITQSLADPYQYTLELTDIVQINRMIKLIFGQYNIETVLENYRKQLRILKNN